MVKVEMKMQLASWMAQQGDKGIETELSNTAYKGEWVKKNYREKYTGNGMGRRTPAALKCSEED
jgi:hypothetical protein